MGRTAGSESCEEEREFEKKYRLNDSMEQSPYWEAKSTLS
jgi:hypothetical protein